MKFLFAFLAVLIPLGWLLRRVVGTNPLDSGNAVLEYSTNAGVAWTPFGSEVEEWDPGEIVREIKKRLLLGDPRVKKMAMNRLDYGEGKAKLEYSSATYAIISGWVTNKTVVWIRETCDDTGGANGSRFITKGPISNLKGPIARGANEVQALTFTQANDDFAFTAAA